ncbi:MAG TPA: CBS domain-containing protein [Acidimicrobiales bacterium]|nr:CBS domain-containing protein [Acidimicrobiales bacterium]
MTDVQKSEPPSTAVEVMHLSCLLGSQVKASDGQPAGKLSDVIVRLGDGGYPPLTGVVVNIAGQERFAHIHDVARLDCDEVRLSTDAGRLGPFERRPGEVLLAKDVAGRHLIHLKGARLVRANEIELACVGGRWVVIGVDPTSKPVLRRLLPRSARTRVKGGGVVDWAEIEPFVSHVPTARLRIPLRKLARLHPAQLADLVEAASHEEGEEIIAAVGDDRELEADVFEELDMEHQVEFLRSRSDDEAARVLAAMAPDDAVDLLEELDQERRLPILQRLPAAHQRKLRSLLNYNPETAGGLMNPDFVAVAASSSVEEALAEVKRSRVAPEAAGVVLVTDDAGHLTGSVLAVELLRANAAATVGSVAHPDPVAVTPDADVHEVSRAMSDYNLAILPVVDEQRTVLGLISVDDVLELLLPEGWRRQYGMTG